MDISLSDKHCSTNCSLETSQLSMPCRKSATLPQSVSGPLRDVEFKSSLHVRLFVCPLIVIPQRSLEVVYFLPRQPQLGWVTFLSFFLDALAASRHPSLA
jgi:hypothetical protein